MSRFFSNKYNGLVPYTPGEQPKNEKFIKLNTNESPFPPSKKAQLYAVAAAKNLQLYSDPECKSLTQKAASYFNVEEDEVLFTNGSDEILNFAFMAFCDAEHPAAFPNITYGFYSVFAELNSVPYTEIPLDDRLNICTEDYKGIHKTIFIANPNAPTGIALPVREIEEIVRCNRNNIVVVDEAYVDFGSESCVPLIHKYDNLLVTQTFSKSRSMAGARLGFGIGCKNLIKDLNTIKYSTNPYNINSMTMAAGIGAFEDDGYTKRNCKEITEIRAKTAESLRNMGFIMTDSSANFLFVKHPHIGGANLYQALREKGILIRHFDKPNLTEYNRITVGSAEQMQALVAAIKKITEEQ